MNNSYQKISIADPLFARMREDIDISIQALIKELLNTGKAKGHLKLKVEIELDDGLPGFLDACGNLHRENECCIRICYRITSKTEPIDRIAGIIPANLHKKEDATFTLE